MKALSINQPFAWLIAHGYKDIETRTWHTTFKGRIYIHASKRMDNVPMPYIRRIAPSAADALEAAWPPTRGCIVGEADIIACVTSYKSPWFVGPYGFVLANPTAYDKPIPYRGRLGFFEVPENLQAVPHA
jgi:hypothetical protein